MDEKNNVTKSHKVLLANRKNGAFSGVVDVLSFDVAEILLETELGMLLIKGHDLHVNRLSLEKGEIDIEGRIDSLTYSEPKMLQNRRNLFLEGFLNNVWICAAGGMESCFAGAGDRKQGERGDFHRGRFFSESRFWWGWDYSCCTIFFVFSEESCHMAQSGLEWKTSVIGYYALLRFF